MMCMRQRVGENVLPDRIQNGKKSALIRVLKHIECSSKRSVFCFLKKIFVSIYTIVSEYAKTDTKRNVWFDTNKRKKVVWEQPRKTRDK